MPGFDLYTVRSMSSEEVKSYKEYASNEFLLFWLPNLALFTIWILPGVVDIPYQANMIITSTLVVFISSMRSIKLLEVDADGKSVAEKEVLSMDDAKKFPLMASISLGGQALAFKYFDKDTVNMVLAVYIGFAGLVSLVATFSPIVAKIIGNEEKPYFFKCNLPYVGPGDLPFGISDIISVVIAIVLNYFYFTTKHFMLNNIFGITFCMQAIEQLSMGQFKIGAILLCGLFFYDIFWVFGTDVMVSVATKFDGPIKLLFPRGSLLCDDEGNNCNYVDQAFGFRDELFPAKPPCSLLGLGDIVIPGLFVALLCRFDAHCANVNPKVGATAMFPKPFFLTNIFFYCCGLVTTVLVMIYFKSAQPALLYLVPFILIASLLSALVTGKWEELMEYNEEDLVPVPEEEASEGEGAAAAAEETKKDK